ncbi:hypothetical protein PS934_00289 [Pseudomonas fluorescens]|nr:hypothetical protein PS934_00289 [Pseudomonas fluorescens]
MVDNDDAGGLKKRGALDFFASRLAPTGVRGVFESKKSPATE